MIRRRDGVAGSAVITHSSTSGHTRLETETTFRFVDEDGVSPGWAGLVFLGTDVEGALSYWACVFDQRELTLAFWRIEDDGAPVEVISIVTADRGGDRIRQMRVSAARNVGCRIVNELGESGNLYLSSDEVDVGFGFSGLGVFATTAAFGSYVKYEVNPLR